MRRIDRLRPDAQQAGNFPTLDRKMPRMILRNLNSKSVLVADLKPLGRQTRRHPPSQISKIKVCLREFGQVLPILTDPNNRVVEGEALVAAARQLGLVEIQAVCVSDLSETQLRRLRLALNKLPEYATWDLEALKLELSEIVQSEPHVDLENTGFEIAEIDSILDDGGIGEEDELPEVDEQARPITQIGDQWNLGDHIIRCDDALKFESFAHLLGPELAGMIFTDPPYNVKIAGNVTRSRFAQRHDFAMATGELTAPQYQTFLQTPLNHCARFSKDGSIHYVCIDWRHLRELFAASESVYTELKNLVVWDKTNPGMGSLYRSQHELIAVYKSGTAPHINNIELGRHGRNRSNVWHYAGQSTLNGTRKSKLLLHPTVKPVALVADAIRDCSNRGDIILDPFGGAGTAIIAAEKTGRRARLIELNPVYVDVTIQLLALATTNRSSRVSRGDGSSVLIVGGSILSSLLETNMTNRVRLKSPRTRKPEDVGYRKPPKHTQFQPGQSGNPEGRRKGSTNFKSDVKRTLQSTVRVNKDGRARKVSTQRASLMVLREMALSGDRHAIQHLLALALRFEDDTGSATTTEVDAADRAILDDYFHERMAIEARQRDQTEPDGTTSAPTPPDKESSK